LFVRNSQESEDLFSDPNPSFGVLLFSNRLTDALDKLIVDAFRISQSSSEGFAKHSIYHVSRSVRAFAQPLLSSFVEVVSSFVLDCLFERALWVIV
jgi:hypothetical protein